MYIRCGECLATSWLESLTPGECSLTDECKTCSATFNLMGALELGATAEEQQSKVQQFADYNEYDLPSAYSILLGILTPEQARDLREQRRADEAEHRKKEQARKAAVEVSPALPDSEEAEIEILADEEDCESPRPAPGKHDGPRLPYDPEFKPAVDAGLLTPMHAGERGKRSAWAARLARRHGLSMKVAEKVADNRITLHSAVQSKGKATSAVTPRRAKRKPRMPGWQKTLAIVASLAILVAVGLHARARWNRAVAESRAVAKSAAEATEVAQRKQAMQAANAARSDADATESESPMAAAVRSDKNGRLMKITAANPAAVLDAYCKSSPMAFREAIAIAEAEPPLAGTRLGIFREATEYYSIAITRSDSTRGWSAGTGRQWIRPRLHPGIPDAARSNSRRSP